MIPLKAPAHLFVGFNVTEVGTSTLTLFLPLYILVQITQHIRLIKWAFLQTVL